ncbi:Fic family protein [Moraxella sp. FZLJ2107]|uniref:Fic family protein n=1 Tax=unclassified Moraxella TaxID=2685852 RepID=UPI0020C91C31|nr:MULTISPECIES: Fic family protein [unclassified Moraxella]UTO05383.1 Fic family protein [Moraxella sp. FZLJ2107]UTO22118.1 Fic family protein [Moraxella sp. FZLJ2109]
MKLPKPPTLSELEASDISPVLLGYLAEHPPTDAKGRYLSWEQFRYRHPTNSKRRWLAQKLNRHTIMQSMHIGGYQFSYCLPHSLQAKLYHIEHRYHQWQWSIDTEELLFEEPITSAQLEGASTTRKVAKELLGSRRAPINKSEVMIVNNYHLMQAVKQQINQPLDIAMILQLHRIATEGAIDNDAISGEFRQDDEIVIADYDGQIVHQPPAWQTLPTLMQAYCDFANADHQGDDFIHPIVKAIILHFLLGFIHPFGDGNGRTARALFYWSLQKSGYTHFDYISISRLLHKAPKQYAQSYIDVETDELDMTYFIAYQLTIINRAISDLQALLSIDQASQSMSKSAPANLAVDYSNLSIHQYQLLTNTPADQVLTAKQVSNELGISDSTARKLLNELESMGLATTVRNGRGKGYLLVKRD